MPESQSSKRISAKLLFILCAAVGALVFVAIYGKRVLDCTNVGWLFDNDHDLRQHFVGWCAYRSDPWHFPIGLIDSLSYPNSMSVIYTDSIPLFAVIFKLFGPYLPVNFQYFGLFGIVSFALMGGFASLLLRRFITGDIQCVIGSVFYVMSAPVIHRLYFHTALAAQWLIIAAMVLWVYDDLIVSEKAKIICWGILGFLCVAIHSYFLPMTGMILAALTVTQYLKYRKIALPVKELLSFCIAGIFNLFILGGFYGSSSAASFGLGTFVANLNTFINPWEIGSFLPELPLQNYFQYEGMAYLGAGIIMLFFIVAAGLVFRRVRKVPEEAFHSSNVYGRVTLVLAAVSFVAAVVPNISFNEKMLLWIPYPSFVEKILSVFRSNGRLAWVAMYILMTAAISFAAYTFRHMRPVATIVLAGALLVQIADMKDALAGRYNFYTSDHAMGTMWDASELDEITEGAKEFIFLYTDNDITLPTGYYAYLHKMRQNNFYYARDIEKKVQEDIDQYYSELEKGNLRDGAIYVIRIEEEYDKDPKFYDELDADMVRLSEHVVFRAQSEGK